MNKIILTSILALTVSTGAFAGQYDTYTTAKVSYASASVKTAKTGEPDKSKWNIDSNAISMGIGRMYSFENKENGIIRAELEYKKYSDFDAEDYHNGGSADPIIINTTNKLSLKNTAVFINGAYDFYTGSDFTPYLTAGIGINQRSNRLERISGRYSHDYLDKGYALAWKIGGGLSYKVDSKISIDVGYTFTDLGAKDFSSPMFFDGGSATNVSPSGEYLYTGDTLADTMVHEINFGIRYKF